MSLGGLKLTGLYCRGLKEHEFASCCECPTPENVKLPNVNFENYYFFYELNFFSKMPFSSLRFDKFCDFRPTVCFFASGSKRFEILLISFGSLTPFIFSLLNQGYFCFFFFVNF
ncbi:hypothetical protein Hanom_Chr16g01440661 [Helianthus anomalus]